MAPLPITWTIVVAAGTSERFGGDKLVEMLDGSRSVLAVSVAVAARVSDGVVVVRSGEPLPAVDAGSTSLRWVDGGATRSESVRRGLTAVPEDATIVLVHDGARPLADEALFRRVLDAVMAGADAVVPGIPVNDTIRDISGAVVDRDRLRAVQTPQGFSAATLRAAHATGADATDDATLAEAVGARVVVVDGDVRNLKITRPVDLVAARALLGTTP